MNEENEFTICSKCKGEGLINIGPKTVKGVTVTIIKDICPKCNGFCYVDWIENVVGYTKNNPIREKVLQKRLENIRKNGRKKENFGYKNFPNETR